MVFLDVFALNVDFERKKQIFDIYKLDDELFL